MLSKRSHGRSGSASYDNNLARSYRVIEFRWLLANGSGSGENNGGSWTGLQKMSAASRPAQTATAFRYSTSVESSRCRAEGLLVVIQVEVLI